VRKETRKEGHLITCFWGRGPNVNYIVFEGIEVTGRVNIDIEKSMKKSTPGMGKPFWGLTLPAGKIRNPSEVGGGAKPKKCGFKWPCLSLPRGNAGSQWKARRSCRGEEFPCPIRVQNRTKNRSGSRGRRGPRRKMTGSGEER